MQQAQHLYDLVTRSTTNPEYQEVPALAPVARDVERHQSFADVATPVDIDRTRLFNQRFDRQGQCFGIDTRSARAELA